MYVTSATTSHQWVKGSSLSIQWYLQRDSMVTGTCSPHPHQWITPRIIHSNKSVWGSYKWYVVVDGICSFLHIERSKGLSCTLPTQMRVLNSHYMGVTAKYWPKARQPPFYPEFRQCHCIMRNRVRLNLSGVLTKKQRNKLLGKLVIKVSKYLSESCCV